MTLDLTGDKYFMGEALRLARAAHDADEVPVAAVIACEFHSPNELRPSWEAVFAKDNVGGAIVPWPYHLNCVLKLSLHRQPVFSNQQLLVVFRQP